MRQRWRYRLVALVMYVQDLRVYRRFAPRLITGFETRAATPEEAAWARSRPSAVGHAQDGPMSRVAVFVAARKGRVAGWHYLQRNSADCPMPGYVLVGLYVRLPFRGLGLGRGLMQAPMDLARAEGADEIHFVVSAENERAIALYRRLGFEVTYDDWPSWQKQMRERYGGDQLLMRLRL